MASAGGAWSRAGKFTNNRSRVNAIRAAQKVNARSSIVRAVGRGRRVV